jgi:hypothetical protein
MMITDGPTWVVILMVVLLVVWVWFVGSRG